MLNSCSDRSSKLHQDGPPCDAVRSWFQIQNRVKPAPVGTPEMRPSRDIESPAGSELLTISYQTYGSQPEPSSDSICTSYRTPTYAVGQRRSSSSPGVSRHGPLSMSKSAAEPPVTAVAASAPTTASASLRRLMGPGRRERPFAAFASQRRARSEALALAAATRAAWSWSQT